MEKARKVTRGEAGEGSKSHTRGLEGIMEPGKGLSKGAMWADIHFRELPLLQFGEQVGTGDPRGSHPPGARPSLHSHFNPERWRD